MDATSWICTHRSFSISLLVLPAIVDLKVSAEKLLATEPKKIIEGSIGLALLALVRLGQILFITQYKAVLVLAKIVIRNASAVHLYSAYEIFIVSIFNNIPPNTATLNDVSRPLLKLTLPMYTSYLFKVSHKLEILVFSSSFMGLSLGGILSVILIPYRWQIPEQ